MPEYESVWNGRDSLTDWPEEEEKNPTWLCNKCWRKKPPSEFYKSKPGSCMTCYRKMKAAHQRAVRRRKKASGICTYCSSRKAIPGNTYCQHCKLKRHAMVAARRLQRIADKRCTRCGGENGTRWKMCLKCRRSESSKRVAGRKTRRNMRLCARCSEPAKPGKWMCEKHQRSHAAQVAAVRAGMRSKGLCPSCGLANDGDKYACSACRAIRREHQHRIYQERIDAGMCVHCGKKPPAKRKNSDLLARGCADCMEVRSKWRQKTRNQG